MPRSAWLMCVIFPCLSWLVVAVRAALTYLLLGEAGISAPNCPLQEFDLSLWVKAVFWKEEVVYKEMRRAGAVVVPLHGGRVGNLCRLVEKAQGA